MKRYPSTGQMVLAALNLILMVAILYGVLFLFGG